MHTMESVLLAFGRMGCSLSPHCTNCTPAEHFSHRINSKQKTFEDRKIILKHTESQVFKHELSDTGILSRIIGPDSYCPRWSHNLNIVLIIIPMSTRAQKHIQRPG